MAGSPFGYCILRKEASFKKGFDTGKDIRIHERISITCIKACDIASSCCAGDKRTIFCDIILISCDVCIFNCCGPFCH